MIGRRTFNSAILSLLAVPLEMIRSAQAKDYPVKPVSIITRAPAGVGPDVIARTLAGQLSQIWDQQVLVINKPGAGGLIGLRAAAEAPVDGYSLYLPLSSTFVALPERIHTLPLDLKRDLAPIALIGEQPMVITANAKIGIDTMQKLVAYAKKHPRKFTYGANQGSLPHLTGELLKERTGIDLTFAPYSNMRQAMQDAVGGTIQVYIESIAGVGGQIKAGALRGLAVASSHRLSDHPEIPTVREALPSIGAFEARGWFALMAHAGVPQNILRRVAVDVETVLMQPMVLQRFNALGTYVRPMSPTQLAAFIRSEETLWRPIVRRVLHVAG